MQDSDIIAEIQSTPVRRLMAYGVLMALGLMIVWLSLTQPPPFLWQVFLIGVGGLCLYLAELLRRATRVAIRLTDAGVVDSTGRVIAAFDNIARVDRSPFAFKPSNGFVLHLKTRADRVWMPGLYWRYGRRVGVGGTIPSAAARFMADQISIEMSSRGNG